MCVYVFLIVACMRLCMYPRELALISVWVFVYFLSGFLRISTSVSLFAQDTIRFWLDQGVDGIRADAVAHIMVYSDYYRDQLLSNVSGAQPVCCQTCCSKFDHPTCLSS